MLRACNSLFYHIVQSLPAKSVFFQSIFAPLASWSTVFNRSVFLQFCDKIQSSIHIYSPDVFNSFYRTFTDGECSLNFQGLSLQPNFTKRGGGGQLDRISVFRGGSWERGGDFFQGGCSFYIKIKLKSEIFHDKKYS